MKFQVSNATALIEAARPRLVRGEWGNGTDAVCMMSALVKGARSDVDCVTAGWPEWLAILNPALFDSDIGAADESSAAYQFAYDVAKAIETPRDLDRARDLFLISRLDKGEHSALKTLHRLDGDFARQIAAVEAVIGLLYRRLSGEDVTYGMRAAGKRAAAARRAASAASWIAEAQEAAVSAAWVAQASEVGVASWTREAARAVSRAAAAVAAQEAAEVALAASWASRTAETVAAAARAAAAAAEAAGGTPLKAARYAAWAAARHDLITALNAA